MSNFVQHFQKGQEGQNKGLTTGINTLDKTINGIQRKAIYGVAAPPKVGKSTLVDAHFILYPFLLATNEDIDWIYFSYEMDRVTKEFKIACFFLSYDFNIRTYQWKGKSYPINSDYLQGKVMDEEDTDKIVPVDPQIVDKLKQIYRNRIIPLMGEYDSHGRKLSNGKIQFIEAKDTHTAMTAYLENLAIQNGQIIYEDYEALNPQGQKIVKKRPIGYIPNNPKKFTIIITDTCRKIVKEKGAQMKETIDEWISSSVRMRNLYGFTFVHIIHTNRSLSNTDRLKHMAEFLYPTGDDVKDSGNLSEEADYMFTLFNPTDEKYGIRKHFGLDLFDEGNNLLYPNYRSLHLVESRHTMSPVCVQLEIVANLGFFLPLSNQAYGYG